MKLENKIYREYCKNGQSSAIDLANKHNLPFEYCKACETDSPAIDHVCAICGQDTVIKPESAEAGFIDNLTELLGHCHGASVFVLSSEENGVIAVINKPTGDTDTIQIDNFIHSIIEAIAEQECAEDVEILGGSYLEDCSFGLRFSANYTNDDEELEEGEEREEIGGEYDLKIVMAY